MQFVNESGQASGVSAALNLLSLSVIGTPASRQGQGDVRTHLTVGIGHVSRYTLKATGWVRTVSGVQSLISVYLLALAVLTYFGRPFK